MGDKKFTFHADHRSRVELNLTRHANAFLAGACPMLETILLIRSHFYIINHQRPELTSEILRLIDIETEMALVNPITMQAPYSAWFGSAALASRGDLNTKFEKIVQDICLRIIEVLEKPTNGLTH